MSPDRPELLSPREAGIARAAELLAQSELVAVPTETVYGLAGDARSDIACARIFEAKGRPSFNPLIVHVANLEAARALAVFDDAALALARAFWPGPLTLVLPLRDGHGLSPLVSAGLETVALRVPAHAVARAVLTRFAGPLAAPSANPSGRISPTTAAHVVAGLGDKLAAVIDGGGCAVGVESTILAPSASGLRLLRDGGIARADIEAVAGPLTTDLDPARVQAPGQLASHYAPSVPLVMASDLSDAGAVRIAFGPSQSADFNLSPGADLTEAAANLFAILHEADARAQGKGGATIHVAPIPDQGLGRAINDRLRRAAAPRDQA